jgi:hypothetical protein
LSLFGAAGSLLYAESEEPAELTEEELCDAEGGFWNEDDPEGSFCELPA